MNGAEVLRDVTRTMYNGIPVWPGDVEYSRRTVSNGDFSSSSVTMSLHTGTHMDAPRHLYPHGRSIDSFNPFLVKAFYRMEGTLQGAAVIKDGPVTPEEARILIDAGVVLVCTSSISIDCPDSTRAHEIILGAGVPVIENLLLEGVPPGEYLMFAFPLKFKDADGSPVRVLLADSIDDINCQRGDSQNG